MCSDEEEEEEEEEEASKGKSHRWLGRTWRRMIVRWRHQCRVLCPVIFRAEER